MMELSSLLTMTSWQWAIFSYLMGSIPFGLFVARMRGFDDIRLHGSGNIGATNVMRVAGRITGIVVLLLDSAKGAIPVLLANSNGGYDVAVIAAGAAVLGHIFPLWLRFRGGKGVATTLAVLLALHLPIGLASIFAWIIAFIMSRISSLSSILAMLATPTFAFYFAPSLGMETVYLTILLSTLVIARHHANIRRLLQGKEKQVV